MNIYEIDSKIQELIENGTDPETGELLIDAELLNSLAMQRERKIENLACYIKNLSSYIKDLKEEEDKLHERRKAAENKSERLKQYISEVLAGEEFITPRVEIRWRTGTIVKLDEAVFLSAPQNDLLPNIDEIVTYEPKISKTAIKDALQHGQTVIGAELVQSKNMSIK